MHKFAFPICALHRDGYNSAVTRGAATQLRLAIIGTAGTLSSMLYCMRLYSYGSLVQWKLR